MKALLFILLALPLWGGEFRKFGPLELGTQATSGIVGAGIGYLFLQSGSNQGAAPAPAQAALGLSVGYTLGVLFSGKLFRGMGNPFLTLIGNCVPFFGPVIAYHLSAGSVGFSDTLALLNLNRGKLSLGLPLPHRKGDFAYGSTEPVYYANLIIIHL